ncbi:MAG: hypothetical protein NWF10_00820 [Candidatus Bathyarchaeota archaeon]|nr:hypothetical protein [Candidatus Bathyarchaeota archaeon]
MSFDFKKALPIILITWILGLATTIALVYVSPSIFPPLGAANIEDEAITSTKIADEAIIAVKLDDGSVTSAKIVDGTITAQDLMDGSILSIKIADGAINSNKIANNSITADKVADGAIVTVKLSDNVVTSAKIVDGTIMAEDISDGSIVSVKVANGAITTNKIADNAITTPKINDNAVTNSKLAPNAIPYRSMYNTTLVSTTSTSFVDIPETSLEITLARRSNLIIMFNAEAWVDGAGDSLFVRALVDSTVANPNGGSQILFTTAGESQHGSYAVNFYLENVEAGTYTVKIQWSEMLGANNAHMADRTLNVIALPA